MRIESVVALVSGADRGRRGALVHARLAHGAMGRYATPEAAARSSSGSSPCISTPLIAFEAG